MKIYNNTVLLRMVVSIGLWRRPLAALCLGFFLSFFWGANEALAAFEVGGELGVGVTLHQRPSSLENHTSFDSPWVLLNGKSDSVAHSRARVGLFAGTHRDATSKRFDFQLDHAFVESMPEDASSLQFRLGLMQHPWIEFEKEFLAFSELGVVGQGAVEQYSFLPYADYGARFSKKWSESLLIEFSVFNGEGDASKETGPHKDYVLSFSRRPSLPQDGGLLFYLAGHMGKYEAIDAKKNDRARALLALGYQEPSRYLVLLELFESLDAVDGVSQSFAQGVNLSSRAGEMVTSQGASFIIRYTLREDSSQQSRTELFARGDVVDPDLQTTMNSFNNVLLGLNFFTHPQRSWSLAAQNAEYEKNHSLNAKANSRILLAAMFKF